MPLLPKTLVLLTLILCAGCAKPSDISVARRDHILAGPHGWIDVTVHAPAAASAPASQAGSGKPARELAKACQLQVVVDGEPMVSETADLAQADAAKSPLGYRFVAPAGTLHAELDVKDCVATDVALPLAFTLDKGHLASLEFDGQHLVVASTQAWEPARLEDVGAEVAKLHARGDATEGALSTLTTLAIASVLLNVLVIVGVLVVALRRRSR